MESVLVACGHCAAAGHDMIAGSRHAELSTAQSLLQDVLDPAGRM